MRLILPVLALMALSAPVVAQAETQVAPAALGGAFKSPDGAERGTLTLMPAPSGVLMRVEVKGLTPGWHGLHFHQKGACSDEKFASAGGHVHNATPVTHGLLNAAGNDAGDLPNLYVHADGTGAAEVYSTLVTAKAMDARPSILDEDGTAVVIHAMADDHKSQPIGNAGARVACAVVQ